ncbi:hypothetical protein KKA27_04285 [Patescibacteria group bacterium]|nr:hypothetical protein [Patescibacteria group bacterium]
MVTEELARCLNDIEDPVEGLDKAKSIILDFFEDIEELNCLSDDEKEECVRFILCHLNRPTNEDEIGQAFFALGRKMSR